ncbi:MAG: peptide chain release factor 1 [Betaproteobacteria bacterium TMED156]|nr:MAG: peptide chain release factor 1 [Betaproteobacteria bacterium TMED156]|tara:strand:- start:298 stop:1374 length:1077 start_codon:yes stop_codon:yes gene_type:complete
MKKSLINRLEKIKNRMAEIEKELSDPEITSDREKLLKLSKERSEIFPVVETFDKFSTIREDILVAKDWLNEPELRHEAIAEIDSLKLNLSATEENLQTLLLPKDPNDEKNVILEIRAGTGGDESALFASDLYRMYARYAERKEWKSEVLSSSDSDLGGFKEIILRLSGNNVYSLLKFESGGHRVQRIPATETQGRIHTSACTVAVLPEAEVSSQTLIPPDELRIDVFRSSGAGGQHVNKTESAVRITHLPTGTVAECQDGRSQHKNREQAMKVLIARVQDSKNQIQQKKIASQRKSLIGSGDRSERIRTYNFPQGRVTDHRINLTSYKLEQVLDGFLEEFSNNLVAEHHANLLADIDN